jgi:hypothetical protein
MLAACGKTVIISDYFEYYRLAAYLARYTKQKIGINAAYLPVFSRDVLEQIKRSDASWSDHVPSEVAEVIRRRGYFGHRRTSGTKDNVPQLNPVSGGNRGQFTTCPAAMA